MHCAITLKVVSRVVSSEGRQFKIVWSWAYIYQFVSLSHVLASFQSVDWSVCRAGYENHIEELEQQIKKDRSSQMSLEIQGLKQKLAESQNRWPCLIQCVIFLSVFCYCSVCCLNMKHCLCSSNISAMVRTT